MLKPKYKIKKQFDYFWVLKLRRFLWWTWYVPISSSEHESPDIFMTEQDAQDYIDRRA